MAGVLDGVRVLDFGRYIAGPYAACVLGDLGAEVIRIERVGGGEDRFVLPLAGGECGAQFIQLNRNKRSLTLDPGSDAGREVVRRLVKTADVVVANLPARALTDLGLDYATLAGINPGIILTAVSAFGTTGPLAHRVGFDGVAQAMSGLVHMTGEPGAPTKAFGPWADFMAGANAAMATLAALMWKFRTGEGQEVEVSLLKSALVPAMGLLVEEAVLGVGRGPTGNRSQTGAPADLFATTDGHVIVQVVSASLFRRWCRMVGRKDLVDDPLFADDALRSKNGAALSEIMAAWCATRSTEEVLTALDAARLPGGPVLTPAEVLDLPHNRETDTFHEMTYAGLPRPAPLLTTAFGLSRTPPVIRSAPPGIGADSDAILAGIGMAAEEIAGLRREGVV
ncbi:MAG: CaiB/BaiF CoA transferase family protein [Sagittula sp.]|uniref:CaiB/BaiF CoA transferase family protein n=1 Tax=Sagittula sp. TaxID=2038081 RepID=UPI004058FE58